MSFSWGKAASSSCTLLLMFCQRSILAARVVWPRRLPLAEWAGGVVVRVVSVLIWNSFAFGLSYGAVPHGHARVLRTRNRAFSVVGYGYYRCREEGSPARELS